MSEYSIASGNKEYAQKALEIFRTIQRYAGTPGLLEPKYLPSLKCQGHSLTMILINTASRLREAIDAPELTEQIDKSIEELRQLLGL